jgi:hypothetical protein
MQRGFKQEAGELASLSFSKLWAGRDGAANNWEFFNHEERAGRGGQNVDMPGDLF